MQDSKPSFHENPEAESDRDYDDDSTRFNKSLQELKDLCSQLHYAANYCETSFLNAEHQRKKIMMENTKKYLCRAVVTVVDHLGSVSANLDYQISKNNAVSETEFRINSLNQRLVTRQQYSHKLALAKLCWTANFPRYHPRYLFPPMSDHEISQKVLRKCGTPVAAKTSSNHEFETEEEVPLFLYTCNQKPSLTKDSSRKTDNPNSTSVLPVRDGLSVQPKARNPSFHFEGTHKLKRNFLNWKSMQSNDILSIIRKSKRAM
ncbi:Protein ABIL5 [Actinidia chinensis var. chinensis]|uniref:Protein ABIL5 n=1 Tax=Actinidia chinensis var. chinensis TaxID=1590841 RepID=A0A2R6Q4T8_ACTCC|nr:Protein ABIL5 [Actinidia chinensis var. chinensis]